MIKASSMEIANCLSETKFPYTGRKWKTRFKIDLTMEVNRADPMG